MRLASQPAAPTLTHVQLPDLALEGRLHHDNLIDGQTLYGIDMRLGAYDPTVDFVIVRRSPSGDIEWVINPAAILRP